MSGAYTITAQDLTTLVSASSLMGGILGGVIVVAAQSLGGLLLWVVRVVSEKVEDGRLEKQRQARVAAMRQARGADA